MRLATALSLIACMMLCLMGCEGSSSTNTSPPEVPKAGNSKNKKSTEPAPEGQTEPEVKSSEKSPAGSSEKKPAETPSTEKKQSEQPDSDKKQSATENPAPAGAAPIELKELSWEEIQKLIAQQSGKVVVVDFWSTSCVPCRKEFPNLVKMHNSRADSVACISVSLDYQGIKSKPVASYREKVLEFLSNQKSTLTNIISSDEADSMYESLGIASIPAVFVYNQKGELAKQFKGEGFSYETDIVPLVDSLLKAN